MPSAGERGLSRGVLIALSLMGLLLVAAEAPVAARASADVVLVREGEVIDEDLYAGAEVVTIAGRIEGDLVVWAFDRLEVEGEVTGDIVGYATNARITGTVGGSVRLVGLDVVAAGDVGDDVMAIAWNVRTAGTIGRDVLAWSRSLQLDGDVGRDSEGQTWGTLRIGGTVGRDVEMTVGHLRVLESATVGEDLGYRSRRDADIAPGAIVGGATIRRSPVAPNVTLSAVRLVGGFLAAVVFVGLGIVAIVAMPRTMSAAVNAVTDRWRRSVVFGLGALATPLVLLILVFTIAALAPTELAFTLLAVSSPLWLALMVLMLVGAIIAPVPVLIAIGRRWQGGRWSAFASFSLLAVPFLVILLFPYLRGIVLAAAVVLGSGSLVRGAITSRGDLGWSAGETGVKPDAASP